MIQKLITITVISFVTIPHLSAQTRSSHSETDVDPFDLCIVRELNNRLMYKDSGILNDDTHYFGFDLRPFVIESGKETDVEVVFYFDPDELNSDTIEVEIISVSTWDWARDNIVFPSKIIAKRTDACVSDAICYSYRLTIDAFDHRPHGQDWKLDYELLIDYAYTNQINERVQKTFRAAFFIVDTESSNGLLSDIYHVKVPYEQFDLHVYEKFILVVPKIHLNKIEFRDLLPYGGSSSPIPNINNSILKNHFHYTVDYHFDDEINLISRFPTHSAVAAGGGYNPYDYSKGWGSIYRTQGYRNHTLNHEFLHRYISSNIYFPDLPFHGHWDMMFSESTGFGGFGHHNGVFESYEISGDKVHAKYLTIDQQKVSRFNDLELYLMGVLEEEDVTQNTPEFINRLKTGLIGWGEGNSKIGFTYSYLLPDSLQVISNRDKILELFQPLRQEPQNEFQMAWFKYMYRQFTPLEVYFYDRMLTEYTHPGFINNGVNYYTATDGRATMSIANPILDLLSFPEINIEIREDLRSHTMITNVNPATPDDLDLWISYFYKTREDTLTFTLKIDDGPYDLYEIDIYSIDQGDLIRYQSTTGEFNIPISQHSGFTELVGRFVRDSRYTESNGIAILVVSGGSAPQTRISQYSISPAPDAIAEPDSLIFSWEVQSNMLITYYHVEIYENDEFLFYNNKPVLIDSIDAGVPRTELLLPTLKYGKYYSYYLTPGNIFGKGNRINSWFRTSSSTNISKNADEGIPAAFKLRQNYPNPFNPSTILSFDIPIESDVKIEIYTVTGHLIETLISGRLAPGMYQTTFNAAGYASGLYYYRLVAGNYIQTNSMLLIK